MRKLVRVKDKNSGHEYSVDAVRLEDEDFAAAHEELDKPAARADGTPLPAKPNVSANARAKSRADKQGRGPESKEESK